MGGQRGASLIALLLVLVVGGLIAWLALSTYLKSSADAGVPGAETPLDETKRQRTIADMESLGRAIMLRQADRGAYPGTLAQLQEEGYLARVPANDAWGNPFNYESGPAFFSLLSTGSDGRVGPQPPSPWSGGAYDADLILRNGQLVQAPGR